MQSVDPLATKAKPRGPRFGSISGKGEPLQKGLLTPDEGLRYAMSLPVVTTITGMDKIDVLHQNLQIAQNFQPMTPEEMEALRQCCRPVAADGRFEHYKVSLQSTILRPGWLTGFRSTRSKL